MKKQYIAPEILFEDFSLSSSIAAGCEVKTGNPSLYNCPMRWGRFTVFNDEFAGACQRKPEETGGEYDGLCYHVPTETYNLFNS